MYQKKRELTRGRQAQAVPAPRVGPAFSWDGFGVVAELKRASPSKGPIADHAIAPWAAGLARAGAVALSVLTEPEYFRGDLAFVGEAARASRLPVLRKDFLVAAIELDEAVSAGAAAVLLIATMLPADELLALYHAALARDLGVLVEIHGGSELEAALACERALIGINQRDLATLAVNPRHAETVVPRLPRGREFIVESGIDGPGDLRWARELGAKGVLVGEALARASDPGARLREWLEACE